MTCSARGSARRCSIVSETGLLDEPADAQAVRRRVERRHRVGDRVDAPALRRQDRRDRPRDRRDDAGDVAPGRLAPDERGQASGDRHQEKAAAVLAGLLGHPEKEYAPPGAVGFSRLVAATPLELELPLAEPDPEHHRTGQHGGKHVRRHGSSVAAAGPGGVGAVADCLCGGVRRWTGRAGSRSRRRFSGRRSPSSTGRWSTSPCPPSSGTSAAGSRPSCGSSTPTCSRSARSSSSAARSATSSERSGCSRWGSRASASRRCSALRRRTRRRSSSSAASRASPARS